MSKLEANTSYPDYAEMEAYRKTTVNMMRDIRRDIIEQGLTSSSASVHKGWDIHCFFPRVGDPDKIVHFQLYIRVPARTTIDVRIREMDRKKIKIARKLSSIGSEETAVTDYILPDKKHRKQQDRYPVLFSQEAINIVLEQVLKLP